jgi:hypothetical protein
MHRHRLNKDAPTDDQVTEYDRVHAPEYLRLLDAAAAGASWEDAARAVLGLNPEENRAAARHTYDSHLERARWMMNVGYKGLLGMR